MRLTSSIVPTLYSLALSFGSGETVLGGNGCTELGVAGGTNQVVPLSKLLGEPERLDDAFITTDGLLYVDGTNRRICGRGWKDLRDCLGVSFDGGALGASEADLVKLVGQWYGERVRLSGRFSARSPDVVGFRGDIVQISGLRLLEPPREGLFCLDNLDGMPEPVTPHDYVRGSVWDENRCGPKDRDALGRLVCLDNWEPWVWTETATGFEQHPHDRDTHGMEIVALGDGRFVAIVVPVSRWTDFLTDRHLESQEAPALAELMVWTGRAFVDISDEVSEVAVSLHDRAVRWLAFAEVTGSGDEGGTTGSEILAVNGEGQVESLWRGESAEVTEILDLGDELLVTVQEDGNARKFRLRSPGSVR